MVRLLGKNLREAGYKEANRGINFFTDDSVLDQKEERDVLLFGHGEPYMAHKLNE